MGFYCCLKRLKFIHVFNIWWKPVPQRATCKSNTTIFVKLLVMTSFFKFELGNSDFIWDFGKLPFPEHLGKYFIKIGKISATLHEIGKIKAIFGLGMTPI